VRGVTAVHHHSHAVTQSGDVFSWGRSLHPETADSLKPILVKGFGGVRVRRVCAAERRAFAVGEAGELFSWGRGLLRLLSHGDEQNQPSPKRVEALRGVRVNSLSIGAFHVLAENGVVYAWGINVGRALLGNPRVERELLPRPIEALRGVRMGSVLVVQYRSYAVADTGELWAWGMSGDGWTPLGHGGKMSCLSPKPIESLRGIKLDAVAGNFHHTLAVADDRACTRGAAEEQHGRVR
jgi:E3 ubiquitin-protein ligase HERC2